jgi:hypothetical protein
MKEKPKPKTIEQRFSHRPGSRETQCSPLDRQAFAVWPEAWVLPSRKAPDY